MARRSGGLTDWNRVKGGGGSLLLVVYQCALEDSCKEHGYSRHAFTLRLAHEDGVAAIVQKESPAAVVKRKLSRNLTKPFGFKPELFVVMEVTPNNIAPDGIHFHGEIAAPSGMSAKEVRAHIRGAVGEWKTGKQFQLKIALNPDIGWAIYAAKKSVSDGDKLALHAMLTGIADRHGKPTKSIAEGATVRATVGLERRAQGLYPKFRDFLSEHRKKATDKQDEVLESQPAHACIALCSPSDPKLSTLTLLAVQKQAGQLFKF